MDRWKGPFFLLLAFSLAGTSVVSARFVSGRLGTFTITAVSLVFALAFLIPVSGRKLARQFRALDGGALLPIALQAFFGIFLFRAFLLYGLARTTTVEAGILTGATPAITALLAAVALNEAPDKGKIGGILCTVAGVALIQGFGTGSAQFTPRHLSGNALVLCAASSESAFNVLSRASALRRETRAQPALHPLVQTTLVTLVALLFCTVAAIHEAPLERLRAIGPREWLALMWYGVFVTALAFICWYAGIQRCGAFTAAAFSGMMPFMSLLLSVLILGEQAEWRQWAGGLMVVAGMALIGMRRHIGANPTRLTRG